MAEMCQILFIPQNVTNAKVPNPAGLKPRKKKKSLELHKHVDILFYSPSPC